MKFLVHFNHEADIYPESNVIVIESREKWFGEDMFRKIRNFLEDIDDIKAILVLMDNSHKVLKVMEFVEYIKTDGALTAFLRDESIDGVVYNITMSMHNSPNDIPSTPAFIEIISDNYVDNICKLAKGNCAYVELKQGM